MSVFEFVLVLASIIVGLAMAELFSNVVRILRGELRAYWLHSIWIVSVLLGLVHCWWSLWDLHVVEEWNFLRLILLLPPPAILFLAAALLFPAPSDTPSLETYYFERCRPFFVVVAILPLAYSLLYTPVGGFYPWIEALRLLSAGTLLALAFAASKVFHAVVSISVLAGYVAFIAVFAFNA